jgi:hypothetical protein
VGVDAGGEPNGTVNEHARGRMGTPYILMVDFPELMKDPSRVTARLNSVGITGIMDAVVPPEALTLYDTLEKSGKLTVRATLAQFYDPDAIKLPNGKPDWERMVSSARFAPSMPTIRCSRPTSSSCSRTALGQSVRGAVTLPGCGHQAVFAADFRCRQRWAPVRDRLRRYGIRAVRTGTTSQDYESAAVAAFLGNMAIIPASARSRAASAA